MQRPRHSAAGLLALCVAFGLAASAGFVGRLPAVAAVVAGPAVVALVVGALSASATSALAGRRVSAVASVVAPAPALWSLGFLLVVPPDPVVACCLVAGSALTIVVRSRRRGMAAAVALVAAATVAVAAVGAGAWSVDEPAASDPRMVAGNGIVVAVDTHAFLLQQGVAILRGDGRTEDADFLDSPDPTAPQARDDAGKPTGVRESYLWRMQLGSRDADRSLKHILMPDHFFNWWTHSGKGLVAGPSAATYAEQQFAQAVLAWYAGDRSAAMYHLGSATHLVDDACTPPHEFFLVPNHRAYEDYMVARQSSLAVSSGGIYATDFRVDRGHGGPEWSSAHTRGWVDECSHRAAELVVNTAQGPPDDPTSTGPLPGTFEHFRDTQRLTAGYLAFFFDSVGGVA